MEPGPRPASSRTTDGQSSAQDRALDAFEHEVARSLSSTCRPDVGILAIGIDYFDVVAASHTEVVPELLSLVSAQIANATRVSDAIAPYDGGFFVLCGANSRDRTEPPITEIARRIAAQFDRPLVTSAGPLPITVSIGMASTAESDPSDLSPAKLQRQARTAVRSAQRLGRSQIAVFDQAIQNQAIESYQTERQLQAALYNEQLDANFQPIVSLHCGETVGIETVARWEDEHLGLVSPLTFIPIAEESGLIAELGRRILAQAVAQGSQWNKPAGPAPFISVDLSSRQLLDPELVPTLDALLRAHDLHPNQLCLEISESVVMSDVASSMTILGRMKDLGLRLAIDNFGTGYSSLSYLRRLPVDILKIDRSFVQSVYNRDDRVITKAIVDLAHTLGMTTVAEGVETRLQVEVLHALNCDMAQGDFLHPPTQSAELNFDKIDFETSTLNENPGFSSVPARTMTSFARR